MLLTTGVLRGSLARAAARCASGLGLCFLVACSSGPSEADCERLRDKLIDLEFVAMGAKAQSSEERSALAKQKEETSDAVAERFKEACVSKTPKELVDCALAATSLEQVRACDEQK